MKRLLKGFAGFGLIVMILFPVFAERAEAEVRFDVSVKTPNIRVRVGNDSYRRHRVHRTGHRSARKDHYFIEDREIAFRLARYAGVRQKKLIRLRRRGYRWMEIGRIYHIPPRVVRAAVNPRGWNRFLEGEMRVGRKGHKGSRRVVHTRGR